MAPDPDVVAIVPAAGQGERLGLGAKAFLKLGGCTLLERVVCLLEDCVGRIIVGAPAASLERARELLGDRAEVMPGGRSRQETIELMLRLASEPLILVQDVTRPFASRALVRRVIECARSTGAAAAATRSHVAIAKVENGAITESIERTEVMLPQTPQVYRREILARAFESAERHGIEKQGIWQLVLEIGVPVSAVEGEERNIKITTPLDWEIAKTVIQPALAEEESE